MARTEHDALGPEAAARRATLLGVSGIATYVFCLWLTSPWLGFSMGEAGRIAGLIVAINVALAVLAPRWGRWRFAGAAYGTVHALLLTLLLHALGGLRVAFLVFVHLFPIFHTAMLGPTAQVFFTANVSGLAILLLALAESTGVLPTRGTLLWSVSPAQAFAMAGVTWAGFNFFALYASSYGEELRRSARTLQDEVAARTTALRAANTELEAKAHALEAAQDELRTLLYAVTHDIKNPVNSILLIADLLRESPDVEREPAVREELDRIIRLAGGTEDMIRDLFEFFQLMASKEPPDWFELRPVVDEIVETIRPQLEARGGVVEIGELPRVFGERRKLGRVVANLLANAMQHAAPGRGRVVVSGAREPQRVHFAVADNGHGIAPRYHAGIFELFGRVPREDAASDDRGGSGVGLAVVRRIIEAHHGQVWVESDVGRGSVFHVSLPVPSHGAGREPGRGLAA
jgi:signal transduction histidine kinase